MSPMASSFIVAGLILFPLMAAGVQVGVVLGLAGMVGSIYMVGSWPTGLALPLIQSLDVSSSYTLMVIPLFVAMGAIAEKSGITGDLFAAFYRWFGRISGGVGIATIATCAGMSSITGSSLAVSASMSKIALPELRRYRYDDRLSLGAIAMGGTLAIMIPPSITLVLYAIFAEQSVGQMLIAGILPGALITTLYVIKIFVRCKLNPAFGPVSQKFSWPERFTALWKVIPFFSIVLAIILGMLFGVWTPSEAAATGLVLVLLMSAARGRLTLRSMLEAVTDAVVVSASIMLVVIGSLIFSNFVALTGASTLISAQIIEMNLSPFVLFGFLVLVYILLGMFLEATSILALTVPLVLPIALTAGWDPVWLGVILVCLMEVAAVTPPVGLNLFVMKATIPGVSLHAIYMGALPFCIVNILAVFILYFYPDIVLLLPRLMTG